jgi:hypothetical protein
MGLGVKQDVLRRPCPHQFPQYRLYTLAVLVAGVQFAVGKEAGSPGAKKWVGLGVETTLAPKPGGDLAALFQVVAAFDKERPPARLG